MSPSSSTKPYLVRAVHEWCVDNAFTPYIVVQVDVHTRVPMQHVRDGQIVLNIAPHATGQLNISNDEITCQARFGGVPQQIYVPLSQVLAIYARETGQGMTFSPNAISGSAMELGGVVTAEDLAPNALQAEADSDDVPDPEPTPPAPNKGAHLRRVK